MYYFSKAQATEVPVVKQEPKSPEFSLDYDLQTQISLLLNCNNSPMSLDAICHLVAGLTDDRQVVSNCLETLELYQLATRDVENPLLWVATGRELATEHQCQSGECSSGKNFQTAVEAGNQSTALGVLQDYSSPQASPVNLSAENFEQNSSSDYSNPIFNVKEKNLPAEYEKEQATHPDGPLKKLPPPPSEALFQNLKGKIPDLNPVITSKLSDKNSENDAMAQRAEEENEKLTLYQQIYLTLEMDKEYQRLIRDSNDYDDGCDDYDNEDYLCHETGCYRAEDEHPTCQANVQQSCDVYEMESLPRRGGNKLIKQKENSCFTLSNLDKQVEIEPCPSDSDVVQNKAKKEHESEGVQHQELDKNQTVQQLNKKLEKEIHRRNVFSNNGTTPNLLHTNQPNKETVTIKKGPSSAPPPPSAALFQSLLSKCTRLPAPVVVKPAQQFNAGAPSLTQLRNPPPLNTVPIMSSQVNKHLSQLDSSVIPSSGSFVAKGNQLGQLTTLPSYSQNKQTYKVLPGVTEITPARKSTKEDSHTFSETQRVSPSSTSSFNRQSSPPSYILTQKRPITIHTKTTSTLPAPPSADLFKNLVKRGPQVLSTNKSSSVVSKKPTSLNAKESLIIDYMKQERKPCQVLELVRVCGFRTKKEVNPTLYHLQSLGLIYKLHDHPPTWKLRPSTGSYDVHHSYKPSVLDETVEPRLTEGTANSNNSSGVKFNQPNPFFDFEGASQKRKWQDGSVSNNPVYTSSRNQNLHRFAQHPYPQPNPSSSVNRSQVLNKETFSAISKNPVSTLNEYAQKNNMEVTFELIRQGRGNRPCFEMAARVGSKLFPSVTALSMKDARREAADLAMRTILGQAAHGPGPSQPGEFRMIEAVPGGFTGVRTHFDSMAALSHHAFLQVAAAIPDKFAGRKVIACMIMKYTPEDSGRVVSLGAGNRCVTGQRLSMEGKTVNDSHAEIVSRRSLLRFLYNQLNEFYSGKESIFVSNINSSKLCVRNGVSFHLYISTAPCGDGALFTPREISSLDPSQIERQHQPTFTNKQQGILRTKIEDGEGTIPIDPLEGPQTWDGLLQGRRLRTMSCSDKICRWNILGLQGSLLSHLIEPIYLESLTLGYLYDHGHLSRAVCCRLQHKFDLSAAVVKPYHVNHPWLGRVTAYDAQRETEKTNNLSVNWTIGDTTIEVTDGRTG